MEDPKHIIESLRDYFDCKVIGSYLFVQANLLGIDDINDIDFICPGDRMDNIRKYLTKMGYKETEAPHHRNGYEEFTGSWVFKKEGEFTLDFSHTSSTELHVWNLEDLFETKCGRVFKGKRQGPKTKESEYTQVMQILESLVKYNHGQSKI